MKHEQVKHQPIGNRHEEIIFFFYFLTSAINANFLTNATRDALQQHIYSTQQVDVINN